MQKVLLEEVRLTNEIIESMKEWKVNKDGQIFSDLFPLLDNKRPLYELKLNSNEKENKTFFRPIMKEKHLSLVYNHIIMNYIKIDKLELICNRENNDYSIKVLANDELKPYYEDDGFKSALDAKLGFIFYYIGDGSGDYINNCKSMVSRIRIQQIKDSKEISK